MLFANTAESFTGWEKGLSVEAPSIERPFSQPVDKELNNDTEELRRKRKDFSNFSPPGNTTDPSDNGPTVVMFDKIGAVNGCAPEPVPSLSHSNVFESPAASDRSGSRTIRPN